MTNKYLLKVYKEVKRRDGEKKEFLQAVYEVLSSFEEYVEKHPELEKNGIIERFVEPERFIQFRVPWTDDKGRVHVNRGYRVEFNSAIGPYKGGIRLHPSVNESIIKFLGFEQVLKNSLTGLPMGGGKGGSDFDPKGKSDMEIMRFCQSFMAELSRHIGADTDVPAGDIGTGAREIGYMFGYYKKIRNEFTGVLTGKGLSYGGSLARPEATGYGLCYFTNKLLQDMKNTSFAGKKVVISGSGNVAIYACQKAIQLGAKVLAMSDSNGYIFDENGIDFAIIKQIKEVEKLRIKEYVNRVKTATYKEGSLGIWDVDADIYLPCATQNEVNLEIAKKIVEKKPLAFCEGANMPCTADATNYFIENKIPYGPAKAANAGGVMVSGFEMSQNSMRLAWTFEEVDQKLKAQMENICETVQKTALEYGNIYDTVKGANIAGFEKVAAAMLAQGIV